MLTIYSQGSFGKITGSVLNFSSYFKSAVNISLTLKNSSNVVIPMDQGTSYSNYSYSNLLPGTYTLTLTYNWKNNITQVIDPTVITSVSSITVNSKVSWMDLVNSLDIPSTNSIVGNIANGGIGHAVSTNESLPVGYVSNIDFEPFVSNNFIFSNGIFPMIAQMNGKVYISLNTSGTNASGTLPVNFTGYLFSKTIHTPFMWYAFSNGNLVSTGTPYINGSRFRISYSAATNEANISSLSSGPFNIQPLTFPSGVQNILIYHLHAYQRGFKNITTNMLCPVNKIFAKLERELKGVKYPVELNKFYFYYSEEYTATDNLRYKVFNSTNQVVLDNNIQLLSDIQYGGNLSYGDNRYAIDVTSLAAGQYILEVINDKQEKFYLRFTK